MLFYSKSFDNITYSHLAKKKKKHYDGMDHHNGMDPHHNIAHNTPHMGKTA